MDAFQESLTVTARDGAVAAGRDARILVLDFRHSTGTVVNLADEHWKAVLGEGQPIRSSDAREGAR